MSSKLGVATAFPSKASMKLTIDIQAHVLVPGEEMHRRGVDLLHGTETPTLDFGT